MQITGLLLSAAIAAQVTPPNYDVPLVAISPSAGEIGSWAHDRGVPIVTAFRSLHQSDASTYANPEGETSAFIARTSSDLLIAWRCDGAYPPLAASNVESGDYLTVALTFDGRPERTVVLALNPSGVRKTSGSFPKAQDLPWGDKLESSTTGWAAVLSIPLGSLRRLGDRVGIGLGRQYGRGRRQFVYWPAAGTPFSPSGEVELDDLW